MKIIAIIQARMGSTRLPGKVLKEVLGKSLLEHQIERVQRATLLDEIVIATTVERSDDVIVDFCHRMGMNVYRGSEVDVLSRYYETAVAYEADIIVRLTSDCPLIDPAVIDDVIQLFVDSPEVDYVSNALERTFPRGLDTEVFSMQALESAYRNAKEPSEREHVTPFIYLQKEKFALRNLVNEQDVSQHRWTVDTEEDFELIDRIIKALYPKKPLFTMQDVLSILHENPSWFGINAHIEQKKL